ncbi:MAG: DUF488 domain-containing protein [Candidatus Nitrohelix vancouverensis]|uniref:DUF488 domain-containing protein n=1 Tax=Candidatus Nitrohelix vancouverensis TaxID=2705534 RepID=A0A7T0C1D1_9BACT|nr:MAG: DUF488 domain-containing protein [Candidatus Nitrohelix vancouverensis]
MTSQKIKLFSIGFTKSSAEFFFERLQKNGVRKVIDVRFNNVSQLSGFAKKNDLEYFLQALAGIDYEHLECLAPSKELFESYRKDRIDWPEYKKKYLALMKERKAAKTLSADSLDGACFLCSGVKPDHCHRSLIADFLQKELKISADIKHL